MPVPAPSPMSPFLRKALVADATISGVAAVMLMVGSTFLPGLLGLPSALLLWAGVALIPFLGMLVLMIRAVAVATGLVAAVIVLNVAWVIASLYVAFGPVFSPTLFGKAFVVVQAATVALFAELQIIGLRRSRRTA